MIADLRGKGGHIRTVPVPWWVKGAIDAWTMAAGIQGGRVFRAINKAGRVWGDGMTDKVLWEVVKNAARRAGIGALAPHDLRRTHGTTITSLGFTLNYDSDALQVIGVERGSRLTEESFSFDTDTPGQVRFGFAVTEGRGPSGTAAVVEFQVIGAEGTVSPLTLSDALVSHSADGPITVELVGADFKVGPKIPGDGDGDSLITAFDALLALKMASNLLPPDLSLDVDGDGKITIDDARTILSMARPS